MRKRVYGRQFNKDTNQRKALFRNLMRSLALSEGIKTTESKAKAIKGEFESHITKAKKGEVSRYNLTRHLPKDAIDRLINDIAPRMKDRQGGYTRIVRLGSRTKDNAEMVLLELVEKGEKVVLSKQKGSKKVSKRETKSSKVTSQTGEKKANLKPLASIKQMVTRQKKGSA